MNAKLIKQYKERFKAVRKFEGLESKSLSIQDKFKQLTSIFASSIGKLISSGQERLSLSLESNWAILKR